MIKTLLSTFSVAALMATGALAQDQSSGPGKVLQGADAFGGWDANQIGVKRHITVDALPQPMQSESVSNAPDVIARPDGAMPTVPQGFKVDLVATGIQGPRAMEFAPNGDLFVANSSGNQVLVFHFGEDGGKPTKSVFASKGLNQPYGIAFYPQNDPQWVYVGNSNGLVRFAYKSGDTQAGGDPETLLSDIPSSYHWTRGITFSQDGKTLYYAVGSGSNVAEEIDRTPPGGLDDWQANHPLGAAWGAEERRADVLSMNPDGSNVEIYATGIRNCSGVTIQPATGNLWCVVNERDELGNNLPPDYATHVQEGAFYGWPWYYLGDHPDPRWEGDAPDIGAKVTVPDVLFQAHSAPLNIAFDTSDAWGADYKGDAFVAMHGSWNRGTRTGYKVVKLEFDDNNKPTGVYEDFMTGFITKDGGVWGRPVGVAIGPDGSLFVSDDGSGSIWRVSKE